MRFNRLCPSVTYSKASLVEKSKITSTPTLVYKEFIGIIRTQKSNNFDLMDSHLYARAIEVFTGIFWTKSVRYDDFED